MPQISNPRLHPSSGNLRKAEGHRSFFFDEKRTFQDAVGVLEHLNQSAALNATHLPEIVRRILVPMEQDRSGDGQLSKLSAHALALAQNRYSSRFFPCADKVITRSTAFLIFWLYAATHSFAEAFQKLGDPCSADRQTGSVQYAQGGRLKELPFRNWLSKMLPDFQEDDLFKNLKPYFNDFFVSESRSGNSEYFVQLKGQKFSLKPSEIKYPKFDCSSDSKESQTTSSKLFDSSSSCQTETALVHEIDCQTIGNSNEAGIQATLESADGQCQAHIVPEVFSSICQATTEVGVHGCQTTTEIHDSGCQFTPEFTTDSAAVQATAAVVSLGCQFELSTKECATEPVNMPTSEKGLQVDLSQEEPFLSSLPGSVANSVIIPAKSSNHRLSARAHRHRKRSSRFAQLRRFYLEYLNRKMNREKYAKKQEKIAQIVNKGVSQGLKSVLETITVQAAQGGASLIIGDNNFILRTVSDSVMTVDRLEDVLKQQQEIEKAAPKPLAQPTETAPIKSVLITQEMQTDETSEEDEDARGDSSLHGSRSTDDDPFNATDEEFEEIFGSCAFSLAAAEQTDDITSQPQSNLKRFRPETNQFVVH